VRTGAGDCDRRRAESHYHRFAPRCVSPRPGLRTLVGCRSSSSISCALGTSSTSDCRIVLYRVFIKEYSATRIRIVRATRQDSVAFIDSGAPPMFREPTRAACERISVIPRSVSALPQLPQASGARYQVQRMPPRPELDQVCRSDPPPRVGTQQIHARR